MKISLPPDLIAELDRTQTCDIRTDSATRILYSTDASIYQIEPLGVALPRSAEGLQAVVELASKYHVPIVPRGSGTSLAGQAIGHALILDCSRWLDRILALNPEEHTAVVEPGVLLANLNRLAAQYNLQFGPDPASAERATLGGVLANNATGAHSIMYGMAADHINSAEVVLSDGSLAEFGPIEPQEGAAKAGTNYDRFNVFIKSVLNIHEKYSEVIKRGFPITWRNSAGYRLNYLLPWSASRPLLWKEGLYPRSSPGKINLAPLLAGSEGTLAVFRTLTLNLVPKPQFSILGILPFPSIAEACDAVPGLLEHKPIAIELIPKLLVELAATIPAYRPQLSWVPGNPEAILILEFSGDESAPLIDKLHAVNSAILIAQEKEVQKQIWNIRRVGLGILDARPQAARPVAFIEDCVVPVERLGDYVREIQTILKSFNAEAGIYAHASAGCLHIRPVLDLRNGHGRYALRKIAEQTLDLVINLGGAMTSEHGDGMLRGEWLRRTYGEELISAMRDLKNAADPDGILNPQKMFDAPPMDTRLRVDDHYQPRAWMPGLDFSRNGGLETAIEQCNGQALCRKFDGAMCPSFQVTREEMHSTRGRSNLLRALIGRGHLFDPRNIVGRNAITESVAAALDLCLACKACKAECPSGVDMAKLKVAFYAEYYKHYRRRFRDYLFGYFHITAWFFSRLPSISHTVLENRIIGSWIKKLVGIPVERPLPKAAGWDPRPTMLSGRTKVIFLSDAFTHYFEPEVEQAAFDILTKLDYDVAILPIRGAGAALLSRGFLSAARWHARKVIRLLHSVDPENRLSVIGVEPPEMYTLRHDYVDLLPGEQGFLEERLKQVWLLDEFLIRNEKFDKMRVAIINTKKFAKNNQLTIQLHTHCHQQADQLSPDNYPIGSKSTIRLLENCGYRLKINGAGCCGMAGTFGYEVEHYDLAMKVGELKLFPEIRELTTKGQEVAIASTGSACRLQIQQGTGVRAVSPLILVLEYLNKA